MTHNAVSNVVFGVEREFIRNIRDELRYLEENGINFMLAPLFHPRFRRDCIGVSASRSGPGTRSDRELESKEWISNVVGKISDWLDMDSPSECSRKSSAAALKQEVQWAVHLSLQGVLLPIPRFNSPNYARAVAQLCTVSDRIQFWLRIPLVIPIGNIHGCSEGEKYSDDGWFLWDNFRQNLGYTHRVSIALELTSDMVSSEMGDEATDDLLLSRWAAEMVKILIIDTSLFVANQAGYPILSPQVLKVIKFFFRFRVQIIFTGKSHFEGEYSNYMQYIRYVKQKYVASLGSEDNFIADYKDTLQSPLQPLMDNLESQTYETFERDPVKYKVYEDATAAALVELRKRYRESRGFTTDDVSDDHRYGENGPDDDDCAFSVTIAVVGAGRGPLVAAALSAASSTGVRVKRIFAIEKNPNAVITLRNRMLSECWRNVEIIATDMRYWNPEGGGVDVMVSELLGSFGDNELSPECLDGAQRCLREGGINIPQDYTSFISPIATSKLWMCASQMLEGKGLNTPFVVKLHSYFSFAPSQALFKFAHPNSEVNKMTGIADNTRYKSLSFTSKCDMAMHGFAGYFESTLYGEHMLSINPQTETAGMFSWFPLFIPLSTPVRIKVGDVITMHMWRCCDSHRVWYEWCLSSPVRTQVQNSNGSSYYVGL